MCQLSQGKASKLPTKEKQPEKKLWCTPVLVEGASAEELLDKLKRLKEGE
jgi:hypothetical protein